MFDFPLLACAAFLAGLVDAVVGGGGLIQIPAIFAVFPKEVPATLLGTNKLASMCGTSVAAVKYARRVRVAWSTAAPAAAAAFALAFVGAWTVTRVPGDFVRSLPRGLDTWLGEAGGTLSAGQARRLCLARALLSPARLIVLDEPTTGLDRANEIAFFQDIVHATQGRTVLLVTHAQLPAGTVDRVVRMP